MGMVMLVLDEGRLVSPSVFERVRLMEWDGTALP